MMASHQESPSIPTRESFYSNLNGTSALEVSLIGSGAPASMLFRFSIVAITFYTIGAVLKPWQRFVVEFSTLVLPCILGVTLLADYILPFLATAIATSVTLLFVLYKYKAQTRSESKLSALWNITHSPERLEFVTAYRVYAMITTVICILAVDFIAFPRRLAKTETHGTGLMDLGVGCFTLANALVSPEARGTFREVKGVNSGLRAVGKSVVSALPIIALGFIRLASVKATDYQEHVSEYGVHWNFFFTLAVVSIFSSICLTLVSPHMSGILALVLAASYQNQLTNQELGEFVLHGDGGNDSRDGLLNANREGLVSCIGYLVIYLAGVQLGRFLFLPRTRVKEYFVMLLMLCIADVLLWVMLYFSELSVEPVCRRSANLSYIIWILAYSIHLLASFLLVELITVIANHCLMETPKKSEQNDSGLDKQRIPDSVLISAFDYNLLFMFLVGNLLTGAVNMSINTIEEPPITGFVIVTGYMMITSIIAVMCYKYEIRIKFW